MENIESATAEKQFCEVPCTSDSVWNHFLKHKNGSSAKCKDLSCGKVIKTVGGSTSGLHCHLKAIHKINLVKKKSTETVEHQLVGMFFYVCV